MKKIIYSFSLACLCACAAQAQPAANNEAVNYPVFLNISENLGLATAFQSKDDPNSWYLLPNQVRLKTNPDGRPMFGFQRFVKNVRSGPEDKEKEEGLGGGVVWFTVGFELTQEERQDMEQELRRRKNGSPKIVGSIAYESGSVELITFGREKTGEDRTQVLGIGSAPLMDGDAISVNIILDAENATKLWQTFKLPHPNIGLNFNMQVRGYHTPVSATIKMNTDKIYNNERMAGGMNASVREGNNNVLVGAEIESITQELMDKGAIVVEQTGDIGEDFEEIKKTATEEFIRAFMQPVSMQDMMQYAQSMRGSQSPLERATGLRSQQITENTATQDLTSLPPADFEDPDDASFETSGNTGNDLPTASTERIPPRSTPPPAPGADPETGEGENGSTTPAADSSQSTPTNGRTNGQTSTAPSSGGTTRQTTTRGNSPRGQRRNNGNSRSAVGIGMYAGFQFNKIKQQRNFSISLSKIRAVQRGRTITSMFPRIPANCMQEINLWDPLYQQRELVVMVDGFNARDFGAFVNYATVNLRKRSPGGEVRTDEVRIDRNNFSREGNHFKLMYGWRPGDNDRRTWLDYEYQVNWSFFGGATVASPWTAANQPALNVSPPFQKYTVRVSGDRETLRTREVRVVTVKIYYTINGTRNARMRTINVARDEASADIDVILPNTLTYDYEIIWQLSGNRTRTTGVQQAQTLELLIDEMP